MSASTYSPKDLRSSAVDSKRFRNNKAKWARGTATHPSGKVTVDGDPFYRPLSAHRAFNHTYSDHETNKHKSAIKHNVRHFNPAVPTPGSYSSAALATNYRFHATTESQMEDDWVAYELWRSQATAADQDITYSFDAAQGPQHGSQILGAALDKAVERFEGREMDRLVKNEYELVSEAGDPDPPGREVDDGFELL